MGGLPGITGGEGGRRLTTTPPDLFRDTFVVGPAWEQYDSTLETHLLNRICNVHTVHMTIIAAATMFMQIGESIRLCLLFPLLIAHSRSYSNI